MEYEQTFRFILILGIAVIVPIGAYHRIKSQATGEKLDRRQEGIFILVTLRPIGIAFMAGLVTYMINPALMAWSSVALSNWLRWSGVVIGITGGLLLAVTFKTLGKNLTDTVVTRAAHTLVTRGPYRWVRHPFYLATALAVVANTLVTANWFLALTGGITFGLLVLRTRIEEEKLIERFGEDYKEYMKRTGRLLPRLFQT
ncbi:MAG TPA: isoprenylcysteine carboxylmethyltransferase family protein [Candidatus Marinimicrobia bacterium]|nr:isoprenylcysteine carboxylmethyltransferase family protein [Candidatus Neomarinimicrobiota bacterium]